MGFGIQQWDENGRLLATVRYETLHALSPITDDPDSALKALGIDSAELKAALLEIAKIAKSEVK